jgi:hypothetical protein
MSENQLIGSPENKLVKVEGEEVNTGKFFQKIGEFKAGIVKAYLEAAATLSTAGRYVTKNGEKGVFHLASQVENVGAENAAPVVAILGKGEGPHVFGLNAIGLTKGGGEAKGAAAEAGNLPLTFEVASEKVELPNEGGSGVEVELASTEIEGNLLGAPGRMVSGEREFTYAGVSGNKLTGCVWVGSPSSKSVKKGGILHGTGGHACCLELVSIGGNVTGGKGADQYMIMGALNKSPGENGIVFYVVGPNQPIAPTGSLITTSGGKVKAAYGLDLTEAELSRAGVALGKNKLTGEESIGREVLEAVIKKAIPLETGRSPEMVAGEITISAKAVTAAGPILLTTEGGTAVGASVVERKPGESFKVKATGASTDRINWSVYGE